MKANSWANHVCCYRRGCSMLSRYFGCLAAHGMFSLILVARWCVCSRASKASSNGKHLKQMSQIKRQVSGNGTLKYVYNVRWTECHVFGLCSLECHIETSLFSYCFVLHRVLFKRIKSVDREIGWGGGKSSCSGKIQCEGRAPLCIYYSVDILTHLKSWNRQNFYFCRIVNIGHPAQYFTSCPQLMLFQPGRPSTPFEKSFSHLSCNWYFTLSLSHSPPPSLSLSFYRLCNQLFQPFIEF